MACPFLLSKPSPSVHWHNYTKTITRYTHKKKEKKTRRKKPYKLWAEDCSPEEEEKRSFYQSTASAKAELPSGVTQFVFMFLTLCQSESRDACRRRSVQRVAAKRTSPFHAFDILLDREYWCLPELIVAPSYTQIKEKWVLVD